MFSAFDLRRRRAKPESLRAPRSRWWTRTVQPGRIVAALQPPQFLPPSTSASPTWTAAWTPAATPSCSTSRPNFQRDVLAGRSPALQLNIDATRRMAQTGAAYIQNILADEVRAFVQRMRARRRSRSNSLPRAMFNPNLEASWFAAINAIINNVTMLGILLTGAALIREREHGTIEHLLVMPVTPRDHAVEDLVDGRGGAGGLVLSLQVMVKACSASTVAGRRCCSAPAPCSTFAAASIGIYMGTIARSMPQFGLMSILILLPLQILPAA